MTAPRPLQDRLNPEIPAGDDAEIARRVLEDCLAKPGGAELAELLATRPELKTFLLAVASNSSHLRQAAFADPERLRTVLMAPPERQLDDLLLRLTRPQKSEAALMTHLRHVKAEAALLIALADIGNVWDVMTVTRALTAIADASLSAALAFLLLEAHGQGKLSLPDPERPEERSGLIVLAMGKQGAGELNYSSDIDLIILFDPDAVPAVDKDDLTTLFVRMTRRLIRILQDRTADGYVFRTDLRLRPDPGATPVALSVPAALLYYESAGQNWERAAMIKARPVAGDIAAGERFLAALRPYIWRKYLDYAAIRDIHSIKRQIHAHKGHGTIAVLGHNVKLGRGGIREIEFFVQTQQLIAGGRNTDLRGRETLAMLDALVGYGWLDAATCAEMKAAYAFLRRTEHRIQMLADEQTHVLPESEAGLAQVARLMGYADTASFSADLRAHLERVSETYSELFETEEDLSSQHGNMVFTGDDIDPGTFETFERLGYKRAEDAIRTVQSWHFGRYAAMRSARARELLTEITPRLVVAFAETDAADHALMAFDAFLGRLPAGVQLFSLLSSNQSLIELLATIMGNAPRLADVVAKRPHVLDAVIEPQFFTGLPSRTDLERRLDANLEQANGYEDLLDRARIFAQEQKFLTGVRVISGTASARQTGPAFARLADVLLSAVLGAVQREVERQHGRVPGGRVALLAMGKLGSEEMTAASDLDLILLYDHDREATLSDGPRPLAPSQYFARLTQRFVTAVTAPTAEGTLYEVDFRLRPSGNAGPLATRVDAFALYQRSEAWTWEHMALTRARVVTATGDLGTEVEAVINEVLSASRDPARVKRDVADMRARLEQEKGSNDVWNLKHTPGGLIDLEFIAQTLRLLHGASCPAIRRRDTEGILGAAADAGLLTADQKEQLLPAIRLIGDLTQILRVTVAAPFVPSTTPRGVHELMCRVASAPSITHLEAQLRDLQSAVRQCLIDVVGPLERRTEG